MNRQARVAKIEPWIGRLLPAVCGLLLGTGGALASESADPAVLFKAGPHDMLYALTQEGLKGIAVGDFGLILETEDGGKTWSRQAKAPTDLGLFAVARKGDRCIAGGQEGQLLSSENCKEWVKSQPVTKARILSLAVNSGGNAFAVGGFGTLLKSSDWGTTWHPIAIDWKELTGEDAEPHLYDVHVSDSGEITVVGEFEMVMRSRDGGHSWSLLHKGARSLFALKTLDDGTIFAVGQEGLILRSRDGGSRWTELKSGTKSVLTGVWAYPGGKVLVSGVYSILQSEDGGQSWRKNQSKVARFGWHQAVGGGNGGPGPSDWLVVGSSGSVLSFSETLNTTKSQENNR